MAVKFVEETKSFKRLNAKLGTKPYPHCDTHKFKSDAYWECYIRKWAFTLYHPVNIVHIWSINALLIIVLIALRINYKVGTCRMGKGVQDKQAVVDSKLR